MKKWSVLIFLVSFLMISMLAGCGRSGGRNPTPVNVIGHYTGTITKTSPSSSPPVELKVGITSQTGNTFSGAITIAIDVVTTLYLEITGTITGSSISFTGSIPNELTITFIGTISGNTISGTYTDSEGGSGTFSAIRPSYPDMVGNWSGNFVMTSPVSQTIPSTFNITSQNTVGSFSGTVSMTGFGTNIPFTGSVDVTGSTFTFSFYWNPGGGTSMILGTGSLSGTTVSGTWGDDFEDSGTFSFTKQ